MKEVCFYKCPICGNIVERVVSGKGNLVCCGKPMIKLEALMNDGAGEKHVPVIMRKNGKLVVKVGEMMHPMEEDHFIGFIVLVTSDKVMRCDLKPECEATCEFDDVEHGIVYEYCNKHGLWKREF